MDDLDSEWKRQGATLTDKTACKEFGLTPDDLNVALQAGALQWRETSIYGNPCLRLLRREVENLVKKKRGGKYLNERQAKAELGRINKELRRLKAQVAALEARKAELLTG